MKAFKTVSLVLGFALFGAGLGIAGAGDQEDANSGALKDLGHKVVDFTIDHRKETAEAVKAKDKNRYEMEVEFALLYECVFGSGSYMGKGYMTEAEYRKLSKCCAEALKKIESKYPSLENLQESKENRPIGRSCRN